MDRENKYYQIIENLIKNHRKFAGLEAILEDIIEDVCEHANVILNSVDNDSVIIPYLEKVVSVSIITVPKKMNLHPEIRHSNVVSKLPEITNVLNVTKVDNSLVDRMINSAEPEVVDNTQQTEDVQLEQEELEVKDNIVELSEEVLSSDDELFEKEDFLAELVEQEDSNSDEKVQAEPEIIESSTTLIEEEIQNDFEQEDIVDLKEDFEDIDNEDSFLEPDVATSIDENNNYEVFEFLDESNEEIIDINDNSDVNNALEIMTEQDIQDVLVNEVSDEINQEEILEIEDISEDVSESDTESDFLMQVDNSEDVDLNIDSVAELDITDGLSEEAKIDLECSEDSEVEQESLEEVELIEEDYIVEEISEQNLEIDISDSDVLGQEEVGFLEAVDEGLLLDDVDDNVTLLEGADDMVLTLDEDVTEQKNYVVKNDFSVFNFTPNKNISLERFDIDKLISEIKELANQKSDLNILSVYNLRYKENLPVSEIASNLNVSEEVVVETLNEIISIV